MIYFTALNSGLNSAQFIVKDDDQRNIPKIHNTGL